MRSLWVCGAVFVSALPVPGQKSTVTPGGTPTVGAHPTVPAYPSATPNAPSSLPNRNLSKPIFFDGRVQFDDGTAGNSDVRIERICGGSPYLQAHTDSKGAFSFQLGGNSAMDTDASEGSPGWSQSGSNLGAPNGPTPSSTATLTSGSLFACELRAVYPGYRSDVFEIPHNVDTDGIHVGTILLHRLARVQGTTLSVTTALAPKRAQKDYEKGVALAAKQDLVRAAEKFQSAVDLYPKYAIAWYALGQIEESQHKAENAKQDYLRAVAADSRYVSPYTQLAYLAGQEGDWAGTAEYSRKALDLNPVEFPKAYWFNAVSNFHLQRFDEAEKSARELVKLDTAHEFPKAENMLGNIALMKGNSEMAAKHLRAYLALSPNADDAESIRQMLTKLDAGDRGDPR